jgi:hypothetical protein
MSYVGEIWSFSMRDNVEGGMPVRLAMSAKVHRLRLRKFFNAVPGLAVDMCSFVMRPAGCRRDISRLWLMEVNNTLRRPTAQKIAYTEPKAQAGGTRFKSDSATVNGLWNVRRHVRDELVPLGRAQRKRGPFTTIEATTRRQTATTALTTLFMAPQRRHQGKTAFR